jgi:hypothetical protein
MVNSTYLLSNEGIKKRSCKMHGNLNSQQAAYYSLAQKTAQEKACLAGLLVSSSVIQRQYLLSPKII